MINKLIIHKAILEHIIAMYDSGAYTNNELVNKIIEANGNACNLFTLRHYVKDNYPELYYLYYDQRRIYDK